MAKPPGLVTLNSGHDLHDILLGCVAFTEYATGGPARILVPGQSAADLTFSSTAGTQADAWSNNPLSFVMDNLTSKRQYTHSSALVSSYPFSVGFLIKSAASGAPAFLWNLHNSADATNDNFWFQYGQTGGTQPRIHIEKDGSSAELTGSLGAVGASTFYCWVLNVSDSGTMTLLNNSLDGKAFSIDGLDGLADSYTFRTTLSGGGSAREILVGGTVEASVDNAVACINDTGVEGTNYGNGTVAHPAVAAVKEGTDTIRVWRRPGVVAVSPETPGDPAWKIDMAGTASYITASGDIDPTASPPIGQAYLQLYQGNSLVISGNVAINFPVDVDRFQCGGSSESTVQHGNANFDMICVFDRGLDSANRTAFYNMRNGGSDEYGLLVQVEADQDIAATLNMDVTVTAGMGNEITARRRSLPIRLPQVSDVYAKALTGRGTSRGR